MLKLLDADSSAVSHHRLLACPITGMLAGDPGLALPVCVVSRIWWAGAETLDDLLDEQFDTGSAAMTRAAATVAGAACITLLPQAVVAEHGYAKDLETLLTRELTQGALHAADGQLADLSESSRDSFSWKQVMTSYVGKTGAAYGRDAAMAAHLAGASASESRGWRTLGRLFGVLRQTANDRAYPTAEQDADLRNGTRTLLLAYALESAEPYEAETLVKWSDAARHDMTARQELWDRLHGPAVAHGYNRRLRRIHGHVSGLLEQLAPPSTQRDLLQWMIDTSVVDSKVNPLGGGV
ncbi:polyprenyl synthetase family protein [Streptomyces sp. NPDC020951]|uniref:polyprenyl synthetase family protein n=1 Tax=Streptomyces sp. NPDC020951 TaxID=3365104 RepID=UPI0037B324E1